MQLRRFILETLDGQTGTGEIEKGAGTRTHTHTVRDTRTEKSDYK